MKLTSTQFERLGYLLGRAQDVKGLDPDERSEVRWLLSRQNPRILDYEWGRVLDYGYIFLGTHAVLRERVST